MITIGLVGCGAWGLNYINTLISMPEVKIHYICDIEEESLKRVRSKCPSVRTTGDYRELLKDDSLDGVIIATPPKSHYTIAADFLSQKKALLVEKPFTLSYLEADTLIKLAKRNNTILMAGHLMEYHPVVVKMKDQVNQGLPGKLRYIFLERTSHGKIRNDVSVHWDLSVHDLSIIRYLVNRNPLWISAQGKSYIQQDILDLITVTMEFPDNLFVQIHANWVCPIKKRQAVISGDKMTFVFDDVLNDFKLQLISHDGDITLPKFDSTLPLTNQCKHFVECIKTNSPPITGSGDILWVIKAMELVEQSLLNNGARCCWNGDGGTGAKH